MITTTNDLTRAAAFISCLALPPAILADDDECAGAAPCRYALSTSSNGVTHDPWLQFHDGLGARFETPEAAVDKQVPAAEPTPDEMVVKASRQPLANRERGSRGLFLFWLLQKGNPRGQQ